MNRISCVCLLGLAWTCGAGCRTASAGTSDVGWKECVSPSGVPVRLDGYGVNAWRLRSADLTGTFHADGAVESLRRVLGERLPAPIAGRPPYRQTNAFPLRFANADAKTVVEVLDVARTPSGVEICGRLLEREAVYGGGERFDRLNCRGTAFDLVAVDGWNRDETTYLPIPLFLTTRGGGFLVNRYETMHVDFGKVKPDEWRIRLDAPVFDGYIFVSRTMKEALALNRSLTGGDGTPPAWSRGPIVCRYAPDLSFFEGSRPGSRRGQMVTAHGVKDVFESHVALGAKPAAMLVEAWPLWKILENPDARAEFEKARDYLRKRDTRLMGYIRVGDPIGVKQPGFKPEYLVHADVTVEDKTLTNACEIVRLQGVGLNPDVANGRPRKYLDITNPAAWNWYLESVMMPLAECGIRGLKIDFCEQMPDDGRAYGNVKVSYRWKDPSVFAEAAVHHAYPTFFTAKLFRDMNRRLAKDGGFLCFARGGGLGANRAPFYWAGDQVRAFPKLRSQLLSVLTSTMSGMPWMSFDMAGYQYGKDNPAQDDKTLESRIFARGAEMAAYVPCLQTHGYVRNVYELTPEAQEIYREICTMRRDGASRPIRPLALEFPDDENTWDIADEFMVGDDLLVAPVLTDATERRVYLPRGCWQSADGTHDATVTGRWVTVSAPLNRLPVFRRRGLPSSPSLVGLFYH